MSQKILIAEAAEFPPGSVEATEIAVVAPPPSELPAEGIRDLRAGFMLMKPEPMQAALAEFKDRRDTFRKWLKEQLVSGVHYGVPPGCEPKIDERGWIGIWKKGKNDQDKGRWEFYPPEQWQAKPCLYKAGADFLCDVLGARDVYEADLSAWKQLGEPKGTFVMTCRLISRTTDEVLGEGRGCRKVGQKGGDENNAIKMAKKCAKVDAVINAWGLADLFTQDLEDPPPPPPVENPEQKPNAPRAQPRGKRITSVEVGALLTAWKAVKHKDDATFENWQAYVLKHAERKPFNVKDAAEWTEMDYIRVKAALENGL